MQKILFAIFGIAMLPLAAQPAAELHALIAPTAEESAWMDVGWQTDIAQAQAAATREGKPIFLWQMDGHPLGCV
jgi:hypothetical protein